MEMSASRLPCFFISLPLRWSHALRRNDGPAARMNKYLGFDSRNSLTSRTATACTRAV